MAKALQYFDGNTWSQFGLTADDLTNSDGIAFGFFQCLKDSQDTLYLFCGTSGGGSMKGRVIRVTKFGQKSYVNLNYSTGTSVGQPTFSCFLLTRDETQLYFLGTSTSDTDTIVNVSDFGDINTAITRVPTNLPHLGIPVLFFQDRFIWCFKPSLYGSMSLSNLYDYTTKVLLGSSGNTIGKCQCLSQDSTLYTIDHTNLRKLVYTGTSILTINYDTSSQSSLQYAKQMVIDAFGDIIVITNNNTVSNLFKYKTDGTMIDKIEFDIPYFNLNTDSKGNYYYSNVLGTYMIAKNNEAHKPFTSEGVLIRTTGMSSYGNNITGYLPAVFG